MLPFSSAGRTVDFESMCRWFKSINGYQNLNILYEGGIMLNIKVTKICNKWHARLLDDGKVLDEMACASRLDIGWICREMLRWYDKAGNVSKWAASARKKHVAMPVCKVWYKNQLN